MANRILTTHVGSLPRPAKLLELSEKKTLGEKFDEAALIANSRIQWPKSCRSRKRPASISSTTANSVTPWGGLTITAPGGRTSSRGSPALRSSSKGSGSRSSRRIPRRRWRQRISSSATGASAAICPSSTRRIWTHSPAAACLCSPTTEHSPLVTGPVKYKGQDLIHRDIANFKAGLKAAGLSTEGAWMNAIAPASCARMPNEYYKTEEELLYACADAIHDEYKAIIDAGLTVQLDDPAIGENWDQAENRTEHRGLSALHEDANRRPQPFDQGDCLQPNPLPPVLGKLARPAHHRYSDETPRRSDAGGQLRLVTRSRPPMRVTSTSRIVEEHQSCPRQKDSARHCQPLHQPDRGPRTGR